MRDAILSVRRSIVANGYAVGVAVGAELVDLGRRLVMLPFRSEEIAIPPAELVDAVAIDVIEDLVAYTQLPRERVLELVARRHEDFRLEWHAFPRALRHERWYYQVSRTYLFANAAHTDDPRTIVDWAAARGRPLRILDYGGGAGNTSLALAAAGHSVDYLEISALQKDFVRFRADRYGVEDRLRVRDAWSPLGEATYDAVVALDVLEHLPELEATLQDSLIPALRPDGALVERSPFVVSIANPMHHDDAEVLDATLRRHGFSATDAETGLRVWRRSAADGYDRDENRAAVEPA